MAKSKKSSGVDPEVAPLARVVITFFENTTDVQIENFEHLTPRKIQRSFGLVFRQWNIMRREAVAHRPRGSDIPRTMIEKEEGNVRT